VSRALLLVAIFALAGCDEESIRVGSRPSPNAQTGTPAGADIADAGINAASYRDEDFAEAEGNRDPFRNQARIFQTVEQPNVPPERIIIMPDTGIDEMHLIAIVSNIPDPRAMLVDRNGVGYTVRRGSFVGRPEVVQAGGTQDLPVTLNWRVERIRPDQIVLMRQDPTAPNQPPLTRVIALHQDAEGTAPPR
jgi:hypothetical protein